MSSESEIVEVVHAWFAAASAGDTSVVDRHLSKAPHTRLIGSDEAEWLSGGTAISAFLEGEITGGGGSVTFTPTETEGNAIGDVAWAATKLDITFPDGRRLSPRWTAVMVREEDVWKIVQTHASLPVDNTTAGWAYGDHTKTPGAGRQRVEHDDAVDPAVGLSQSATEVMRAYAAAWETGDPDRAFAFYADDVVMRLPGRSTLAGVHEGRHRVISTIQALLARTTDATVEVEVLDTLVSEDRVGMVLRESVTRGTRHLELRRVNLYSIEAGLITEIDIYEADQYDVDSFFG